MDTSNTTDLLKCEISIVYDGHRHPTWLLIPSEKVDYLNDLYSQACAYALGSEITSISFIQLVEVDAGSVESLLETIKDNVDEDHDWSRIDELAQEVSKEVQAYPTPQKICVEFVWNCGGGDDNIFTDSFEGIMDGPATQAFLDALEEMAEDGDHFYDFAAYDPQDGHINDVGIDEILSKVREEGTPQIVEFIQALRSVDMRVKLDEISKQSQNKEPAAKPKIRL